MGARFISALRNQFCSEDPWSLPDLAPKAILSPAPVIAAQLIPAANLSSKSAMPKGAKKQIALITSQPPIISISHAPARLHHSRCSSES